MQTLALTNFWYNFYLYSTSKQKKVDVINELCTVRSTRERVAILRAIARSFARRRQISIRSLVTISGPPSYTCSTGGAASRPTWPWHPVSRNYWIYINNVTHFLLEKIAEFIIEIEEKKPSVLCIEENRKYSLWHV